ncbi:3-hydroxyacyl-[acyl-carrier-protein] dehydratase [Kutzneria viridogrisea]|uniref:3-hydroxyacyl-[acyl-carrier-protein] dehydratase n=1 Tax=Kutzneria viridogrisea TaxID=47990 RepID=A0ABR6B8X4_9PSEU|nr:3-hydroxyacyl-[acyl-carrier-protein] dehydratase [Kutzneria viridogrisea]
MRGWPVRVTEDAGDRIRSVVEIAANDPVFEGHYPGFPILPGLYLVQYVDSTVRAVRCVPGLRMVAVERVRFLRPVRPGGAVSVEIGVRDEEADGFRCSATVSTGTEAVCEMRLRYRQEAA